MELIYTDQQNGFEPDKHYRNPLYFEGAENGVSKVIIHGNYPAVAQAYQAKGVEIEQVVSDGKQNGKQNGNTKMTVDELKAKLAEIGVEVPPDAKKADLVALLEQSEQ